MLSPATQELHYAAIRHLKGLLRAWELWLVAKAEEKTNAGQLPDPKQPSPPAT